MPSTVDSYTSLCFLGMYAGTEQLISLGTICARRMADDCVAKNKLIRDDNRETALRRQPGA